MVTIFITDVRLNSESDNVILSARGGQGGAGRDGYHAYTLKGHPALGVNVNLGISTEAIPPVNSSGVVIEKWYK